MSQSKFSPLRESDSILSLRFTLPVIIEQILVIFIGMAVSRINSAISASAMAAIGMANTVHAVVVAFFSIVTGSSAVLVSRHIGAGEGEEAAEVIEQSVLLSAVIGLLVMALTVVFSVPMFYLLMPTAEEQLFNECVRYFRLMMYSIPSYIVYATLSPILRALGNSRGSSLVSALMNALNLFFSWLFIHVLSMNEAGAGYSLICCRLIGFGCLFFALMRDHRFFRLKVRKMLRPRFAVCWRILQLGAPMSLESIFVQVGYMLANSMAISLGTFESGVYQIMNTLNSFGALAQGICSAIASAAIGQLIGAGAPDLARRAGRKIWAAGIAATVALCGILILAGVPLSGLYSSDPATVQSSASLLWILLVMDIAGVSINAIDPQLRAGGDVNYVMGVTVSAVWVIRLPLTWLFCFKLNMGVLGIYLANTISLYYRAVLGFARHCGKRWYVRKI